MSKESQAATITDVALRLGTRPEWLDALINFETRGTYSPSIKNPLSSARGLIQVIDSTARSDFGVADSLTLVTMYPDFDSQMENVVYPYLAKYAPFGTKQELYMAVFYPAYRSVDPQTEFPASVQAVNPGIRKVQDYIDFVDAKIKTGELRISKVIPVLAIVGTGIIAYLWWRNRNR